MGHTGHTGTARGHAVYARLRRAKGLKVVPGATHLFEEPGTLEENVKATSAAHGLVRARGRLKFTPDFAARQIRAAAS